MRDLIIFAALAISACGSAKAPAAHTSVVPDDALRVGAAMQRPDGLHLRVRGFIWVDRPPCAPCPTPGTCGQCSGPTYVLAENRQVDDASEPGPALLADVGGRSAFDVAAETAFEGHLETRDAVRIFVVEAIVSNRPR